MTFASFGQSKEELFVVAPELRSRFNSRFDELPTGAMGFYSYMKRLEQGLQQLMCGARKFALKYITRSDIAALTLDAARISGIEYVMDCDREEAEKILDGASYDSHRAGKQSRKSNLVKKD